MYRTHIQKGDRIVLLPTYDGLRDDLREHAGIVLIAGDVEMQVDDIAYGAPATCYEYFHFWKAQVEGSDEYLHFGRTSTRHFERIPLWEEVLGPLAPDWPPMTLEQFRRLPENLELVRALIKTTFQLLPTFLKLPG